MHVSEKELAYNSDQSSQTDIAKKGMNNPKHRGWHIEAPNAKYKTTYDMQDKSHGKQSLEISYAGNKGSMIITQMQKLEPSTWYRAVVVMKNLQDSNWAFSVKTSDKTISESQAYISKEKWQIQTVDFKTPAKKVGWTSLRLWGGKLKNGPQLKIDYISLKKLFPSKK